MSTNAWADAASITLASEPHAVRNAFFTLIVQPSSARCRTRADERQDIRNHIWVLEVPAFDDFLIGANIR